MGRVMAGWERYKRQITFEGIGEEGQRKLSEARVCIIGVGALGTIIANSLCRAGVGFLRVIDRDHVEETNLQRQILFTERDVAECLPKAVAAANHLSSANSSITIESVVDDVNASNIERFIGDVDLVMDGSDNFETRFLINEACDKHKIQWIYGGVVASGGATMNVLMEDDTPCFRCFMPEMPEAGAYPTCNTVGVINPITGIVASYQAAEAMKILTGADGVSRHYLALDVWENISSYIEVEKNPDCPVCVRGEYALLDSPVASYAASLCGQDSWQIIPEGRRSADFDALADRLARLGEVKVTKFLMRFDGDGVSFRLFPDGRAMIDGAEDESAARRIYAEYIGA
ncbi:MAG: ThiF family adenylyltransferase [Clostridiales Family XIII bacterium]|jgi:adenylyltransferase/sulfurtransferase|nr:ThiF family adenylyltransferase [Clostridiales Family XIII bacterium]